MPSHRPGHNSPFWSVGWWGARVNGRGRDGGSTMAAPAPSLGTPAQLTYARKAELRRQNSRRLYRLTVLAMPVTDSFTPRKPPTSKPRADWIFGGELTPIPASYFLHLHDAQWDPHFGASYRGSLIAPSAAILGPGHRRSVLLTIRDWPRPTFRCLTLTSGGFRILASTLHSPHH